MFRFEKRKEDVFFPQNDALSRFLKLTAQFENVANWRIEWNAYAFDTWSGKHHVRPSFQLHLLPTSGRSSKQTSVFQVERVAVVFRDLENKEIWIVMITLSQNDREGKKNQKTMFMFKMKNLTAWTCCASSLVGNRTHKAGPSPRCL